MTKTIEMNGPTRKTLASQLDRLDSILDGLSEGLSDAVASAVREAVGLAVQEAVHALTQAVENSVQPVQLAGQRLAGRAIHLDGLGHGCLLQVRVRWKKGPGRHDAGRGSVVVVAAGPRGRRRGQTAGGGSLR